MTWPRNLNAAPIARCMQLLSSINAYVRDWAILSCFFACFTFPYQLAVTRGVWPLSNKGVQLALQGAAELGFFVGG